MTIIILPTLIFFFFAKHAENLIKIMFQYSIGGKEMIFKRDPPIPLAMHMTEYEKKEWFKNYLLWINWTLLVVEDEPKDVIYEYDNKKCRITYHSIGYRNMQFCAVPFFERCKMHSSRKKLFEEK